MAESILHFGAVRLRAQGTGNLKLSYIGLDDVSIKINAPLILATSSGREPTILTNFISQRARLHILQTEIDDYMKVNRVVLYMNAYAEEFPK